jgi:hypothetical protein
MRRLPGVRSHQSLRSAWLAVSSEFDQGATVSEPARSCANRTRDAAAVDDLAPGDICSTRAKSAISARSNLRRLFRSAAQRLKLGLPDGAGRRFCGC